MKKIANSLFGATNCRTNLKIFQSYIVQNPNWKGVSLLKKMPTLVFWTYWGGGGVCQSAQNCPIKKFLNFFLHKIQIQRGFVLWKKLPTHVFEAPFCGPFWKMGGLPIGPELADLKNFQLFPTQNQNSEGVCFMKKFANSCINGPTMQAVWDKWGCRPFGPNWTNFDVWEHFPVQNQNSKGVSFMKKLPSHLVRAPCGRLFWSNAWLPTGQIWADQIFLIDAKNISAQTGERWQSY